MDPAVHWFQRELCGGNDSGIGQRPYCVLLFLAPISPFYSPVTRLRHRGDHNGSIAGHFPLQRRSKQTNKTCLGVFFFSIELRAGGDLCHHLMWCPAGHQAKEVSCQQTIRQPYRPRLGQSMDWRRLTWKLVLADEVATAAGAACPEEAAAPQESLGATGEWPPCGQVLQAPVWSHERARQQDWAGSARKSVQGLSDCAEPFPVLFLLQNHIWRQGLGWALLPGPPSHARSPILHRGASWLGMEPHEQAGLERWGADRKEQRFQNTTSKEFPQSSAALRIRHSS